MSRNAATRSASRDASSCSEADAVLVSSTKETFSWVAESISAIAVLIWLMPIGAVGKLLNTQQQAHFFDPRIHAAVELIHHLVSGIGTAIANIRLELNGRFPGSDPTQQ